MIIHSLKILTIRNISKYNDDINNIINQLSEDLHDYIKDFYKFFKCFDSDLINDFNTNFINNFNNTVINNVDSENCVKGLILVCVKFNCYEVFKYIQQFVNIKDNLVLYFYIVKLSFIIEEDEKDQVIYNYDLRLIRDALKNAIDDDILFEFFIAVLYLKNSNLISFYIDNIKKDILIKQLIKICNKLN